MRKLAAAQRCCALRRRMLTWVCFFLSSGLALPARPVQAAPNTSEFAPIARQDFAYDHQVMAVLSRAGCNQGTCHGNFRGKGDFRLSLRGQDAHQDYLAIAHELGGRRINRVDPDESLLLLKATTALPHQGGQRFTSDSPEYKILRDWIAAGVPAPQPTAPQVVSLQLDHQGLIVRTDDSPIVLQVEATFSDGTHADVTELATYECANYVAQIAPSGVITRQQAGEATILVRYLNEQVSLRVAFIEPTVATTSPDTPSVAADKRWIDQLIDAKLQALQITPGPRCDDTVFVRRVYLDTLGLLPSIEEARAFLTDNSPDKRARLIDQLLSRPEYAENWAYKWSDLLRSEEKLLDATGVEKFHAWLVSCFQDNLPLDEFARRLVASQGSTYEQPAANYYRALRDPLTRGETTARVFLGVRLECAKCHNHPFDHWTQDDYYDWASVFARIDYEIVENNRKDKFDKQEFVGEQRVLWKPEGEVENPRHGRLATARFLSSDHVTLDANAERLPQLANWLTAADNEEFALAQANRIWFHLFGRGLVDPI
ncbi:MAG: DUF1549 domain-containing protein, partial [Planctomycetales bacterium]|nr:DUF1549 domain-containing protein [Planctomycetales bacterium]